MYWDKSSDIDGENCVVRSNKEKAKRIRGISDIDDLMHDHFLDDSGEQQIEKVPKHSSCQKWKRRDR